MELRESIESINEKLAAEFGLEFNSEPRFRVVFSDDQFEKRWTKFTDEGFELIHPEVRLLPKYKQHIRAKFILERLIPIIGETDLTTNISYEPAWVFQDKDGNYLPPWFEGCRYVIDAIYSQIARAGTFKRYTDPLESPEERMRRVEQMERELFGNETDVSDALTYGDAVTDFNQKVEFTPAVDAGNKETNNGT